MNQMSTKKKIIVAAANGFIGTHLVGVLSKNYEVITLTRHPFSCKGAHTNVLWDGKSVGDWLDVLEGSYAVINLSGKSVNCRHNEKNKRAILSSRIDSTGAIADAIEQCENPPLLWLNASGVSVYKESYTGSYNESATEFSDDFLAEVSLKWEEACLVRAPKTRKIVLRTAVVLGRDGGSFPLIRRLTSFFLGGKQGSGNQFFSWIHIDDYCQIVATTLLEDSSIEGPVNMCAPEVVSNKEFMRSVRKAMGVPFGLPTPEFALKIGGFIVGTEPSLVLKSTAVAPAVLKAHHAKFTYPDLMSALEHLTASKKS